MKSETWNRQDLQSSYSFEKIQNVGSLEVYEEKISVF